MKKGFLTAAAVIGILSGPATAEIVKWNPEKLFNSSEFSHVVTSDQRSRVVFISAQGPILPDGTVILSNRVKAQTKQVLENLTQALAAAGAKPEDIVRIHIYVTDYQVGQGIIISGEMRKFFNYQMPTSSFIPVSQLEFPGAILEIDAIAEPGRAAQTVKAGL
ncbi:enamine deaminase RidA (YjgF/YER057c/UK114 family) [Nitrospirillum amazonense]|uniref:Enamine deaminase RidA (YjgF/YER057c/UK114 family) n=1 Tax=Nitrospirillum amazonense TaxID=28077 RepID=A0A560ESR0_9PROT|nr:RidA family protein [Nitrospirillum amazonense]TWB12412.1 enamine deaminase RidA (YjgF/YER057c/UK114 family) [Nitrospirillum amazonense]